MKTFLKIVVPIAIFAAAIGAVFVMMKFRTEPEKTVTPKFVQSVEVLPVTRTDVKLLLPSQGVVEAEVRTTLASEVSGRVVKVSPRYDAGELFDTEESLAEIDAADYRAALAQAEAGLAEAKLALVNEEAKAEQAVRDWNKIAAGETPSDLAVRKPQIESATAQVAAATAMVEKAKHDLERTSIRAPYKGRLSAIHAELGAYITPGARVCEIYSVEEYEVKLPLSLDDFAYVEKPGDDRPVEVKLAVDYGMNRAEWKGRVVRIDAEVDRASRSVQLIAAVKGSAGGPGDEILKPGLFVKAQIEGRKLEKVFRVPRRAFLDEKRVITVDGENRLRFREVQTVRGDGTDMLVSAGLENGDRICMTALAAPVEGTEVKIIPSGPAEAKVDNPQQHP